MAAPRGATYAPTSGPLAGTVFTGTPGTTQAYNRYQQARARALGFSSYRGERQAKQGGVFKGLMQAILNSGQTPTRAQREDRLRAIAERQRIETVVEPGKPVRYRTVLDVDFTDHSRGGSYDLYLQRLNLRTGNESWPPGETP